MKTNHHVLFLLFVIVILAQSRVASFAVQGQATSNNDNKISSRISLQLRATRAFNNGRPVFNDASSENNEEKRPASSSPSTKLIIPLAAILAATAFPSAAEAGGVIPTALWTYAHFFSIIVITAILATERALVRPNMSLEEEDSFVKLDLVYGLMAVLLIGSGFAKATNFGMGGDYYIHEILFWVKMTFSGVWGGLTLFPSLTFYKRSFARKNGEEVGPVSEKLSARLTQIINAEISAILTIPLLAILMARGVWYSQDFPYTVGMVISVASVVGSSYYYGKQALTWTEGDSSDKSEVTPLQDS